MPNLIRLSSGTLASVFQWFRQPVGSASWDRVAIKFSSDNGVTWTEPQPIIVNELPGNFQRPFDPTLSVTDENRIRIYFSSGLNLTLDTSINTYSAISDDGINYTMDPGFRFSLPDRPVVDPAVIKFRNLWHLANPLTMGAGAYHNISNDGLNYTRVTDIVSDMNHSWIGNYMIKDTNELRFYGSGAMIWYSSSTNGGAWSGFTSTNISGGDPSALKISDTSFIMIYTGQPYSTSVSENNINVNDYELSQNYPNPFNPTTNLEFGIAKLPKGQVGFISLRVYNIKGEKVSSLINEMKSPGNYKVEFRGDELPSGIYFYSLLIDGKMVDVKKMTLLK